MVAVVVALLLARAVSFTLANAHEGTTLDSFVVEMSYSFTLIALTTMPVLFAIVIVGNLGPIGGLPRVVALASGVLIGSALGLASRLALLAAVNKVLSVPIGMVLTVGPRTMLLGGMLVLALEAHRRALASVEATRRTDEGREALERELAGSRLQALQAQIEPHFLFNTLANVRRLCDIDLDRGRAMLGALARYLEMALPCVRQHEVALGSDAELVEAYLHIHQIRMGARLRFAVDVPAELRAHRVPPLMLLTLVENAVKHGIQPSRHGGVVRVSAREHGGQLMLTVADSGVGIGPGSGSGTGLANVRARLAAQFGEQARLELTNNELGGLTATIGLPLGSTCGTP